MYPCGFHVTLWFSCNLVVSFLFFFCLTSFYLCFALNMIVLILKNKKQYEKNIKMEVTRCIFTCAARLETKPVLK